jgi:hypothetical protein
MIKNNKLNDLWDEIIAMEIATESELQLVTDINGYNVETLNSVIFSKTGYRNLDDFINYN